MTLKLATEEDIPDMTRMVERFISISPYQGLTVDRSRIINVLEQFLDTRESRLGLLWVVNDKPVGILLGMIETAVFSWGKTATELVFWVDEEHRRSRAAIKMIEAYEYWCLMQKVETITLVDLMGNLSKLYTRRGYAPRDLVYLKDVR